MGRAMIIEKDITVNTNIEVAWKVLGIEFTDAYIWASAVNHSEGAGRGINGASCSERGCATSMGKLKEKLLQYSNENHFLSYQVAEGMPFMVKQATNTWKLLSVGQEQSKLYMRMDIQLGGVMGKIMQPMMKMMMSKMGNELLEEFKYYVENKQPHPRKLKAAKKYNAN